jgi:hypothetical protein
VAGIQIVKGAVLRDRAHLAAHTAVTSVSFTIPERHDIIPVNTKPHRRHVDETKAVFDCSTELLDYLKKK